MKKNKFEFFIGPCVLESRDLALEIADKLVQDIHSLDQDITVSFKGSFDKANRSSINSYRGPGLEKGLAILEEVKKKYGLFLVTDFHLPQQASEVASVVDVLQVPAFLCRQTDMILAGASAANKYNIRLQIKKGQFLSPRECANIVDKAKRELATSSILLVERGVCFGYNNLIVDMASFDILKRFGVKAIYDATHSVQMPGGLGTVTGGKREQIETLAKAAVAAGAQGVFMETHPEPEKALSDASTCLPLDSIKGFMRTLLSIYEVV